MVRLVAVHDTAVSVDEVLTAVADPRAGGTCVFIGTVRELDGGRPVTSLTYEAHPSVLDTMRELAEAVAAERDVLAVAVVHRVGELRIGDIAVVCAVATAHRAEAFAACRRLIDDLKRTVPIWKLQVFADGTDEWVGAP